MLAQHALERPAGLEDRAARVGVRDLGLDLVHQLLDLAVLGLQHPRRAGSLGETATGLELREEQLLLEADVAPEADGEGPEQPVGLPVVAVLACFEGALLQAGESLVVPGEGLGHLAVARSPRTADDLHSVEPGFPPRGPLEQGGTVGLKPSQHRIQGCLARDEQRLAGGKGVESREDRGLPVRRGEGSQVEGEWSEREGRHGAPPDGPTGRAQARGGPCLAR